MRGDWCTIGCAHYDCIMDRGDVLPEHVTAWIVVDGTPLLYAPSPEAQARADARTRAREEADRIDAELQLQAILDRVTSSS